ncbi:probable glutathione S-transferase [Pistacia vera]|uniref:probable glutathione S-transferase n=1 Tax=Pistacia vera TaxID=55513 RepID=UPI0012638956|nr:probable glutathione S-transferase [Pistacia vera]
MARFWAKYGDEKAMWSKGEEKAKAIEESIEALEKIEGELKEKKYFEGEGIGYLDLAFGWIAYWLPVWEKVGSMQLMEEEKFPAITSWISKFLSHPAIKDKLPPKDECVEIGLGNSLTEAAKL